MQQCVQNCSLCKEGKPEHRRTQHCSLDPEINPYRRFDAERQCDFCGKDHEPFECKDSGKSDPCKTCGHGWHTKKECMLDPSFDSLLEQFTLHKYRNASLKQKARPEVLREEDRESYNRRFKKGRHAQPPSSTTLTSIPSKSGPSQTGNSASRDVESHPLVPSLSTSSQPHQTSQASGPPQIQTQSQPSSGDGVQDQNEKKTDEEIRKENCEKKKANHERWAQSAALNFEKLDDPDNAGGNRGKIKANFFRVNIKDKDIDLRRYHVKFGQIKGRDVTKASLKRTMMEAMFASDPPAATHYATDYSLHIISVGKLYAKGGDTIKSVITKTQQLIPRPGEIPSNLTMQIEYDGPVNIPELGKYLNRNASLGYVPDEDLKALNIVSWEKIYMSSFAGGRVGTKFYPTSYDPLEYKKRMKHDRKFRTGPVIYKIKTGFFTSMRPGDSSLFLNVNSTATAFLPPVTVHEWIDRYISKKEPATHPGQRLKDKRILMTRLKGIKVTFANSQKQLAICDISDAPANATSFLPKPRDDQPSSGRITVYEHMRRTHPNSCGTPTTFCINVGSLNGGNEIWYPADTITIVDWQCINDTNDADLTEGLLECAQKKPIASQGTINDHAKGPLGIGRATGPNYSAFGLSVQDNFTVIENVRKLGQPSIMFGGGQTKPGSAIASWDLKDITKGGFLRAPSGGNNNLSIIRVGYDASDRNDRTFVDELCNGLKGYLVVRPTTKFLWEFVPDPRPNVDPNVLKEDEGNRRRDHVEREFNRALASLTRRNNGTPSLLVILLSNKKNKEQSMYADIKWWGDCVKGIPTASGGVNHRLSGDENMGLKPDTMIIGADVTHPKAGNDRCPSMTGVVATVDDLKITYHASARLQDGNTEYIADLDGMVYERLVAYFEYSKRGPSHMMFYRDGVSESQYGMVHDEDLPQIRAACARFKQEALEKFGPENESIQNWNPSITVLVVGKRHNTRFYPYKQSPTDDNCPAGLVVDKEIINPNRTSFYLQSHHSPLGTARSAHYVIIKNEGGYTIDQLEEITNKICHTGSRATTALSVCTPARYADILCDRLRCYMHPALNGEIHDLTGDNSARLNAFRADNRIWGSANGNPWHPNVNDIMFYL
ncbi:hypothetical protein EAE96_007801 [Botrytis aclada]|nr:hypothetical protein EAE96_007801 [Botrytis aclada]